MVILTTGYSYTSDELIDNTNIALATIKNFNRNGGFKEDGYKPIIPTNQNKIITCEIGDILVAHTDLTQNADIIGNPILLITKGKYDEIIPSSDLVKVVSKTDLSNQMIYMILRAKDFKEHALKYCSGSTVLHLSKKALREYSVNLPKINQLIEFDNKIQPVFEKIKILFDENLKLEELKQLYLKRFFD